MKNFARITLCFSVCFIVVFPAVVLFRFLSSWIETARIIPVGAMPGEDIVELTWKALPVALYLTVLISTSYAARRKISIPLSIISIVILSFAFIFGFSQGIKRADALRPAFKPGPPIKTEPGLILSHFENTIILLKENSDARGPRVVSFPDRPLIYQEVPLGPNNSILGLPALALGNDAPWIIRSIHIDFNLSAAELKNRLEQDLLSFAAYVFSLILLLASLRFVLELSQWPMANIFLGALVYRGILALEVFLNKREVNTLIVSFLNNRAPAVMVTPLAFGVLGILILLYTILARAARPRRHEDG
jgi:hypothetical protein